MDGCQTAPAPLVLASKSPRRAKILSDLGFAFEVLSTEAREVSIPHAPKRTVTANAALKLEAARRLRPGACILAADTIVWYGGKIYGKPRDAVEAAEFLRELSGNVHTVFTGVAFALPGGKIESQAVCSDVKFRVLPEDVIAEYIRRVNPLDRAGAYDIDESGDLIVESYSGSYENIMGLPAEPVLTWLGGAPENQA